MRTAGPSLDIPPSWKPALETARAGGVLLLIGAVDSGKSTLAAVLAEEARAAGHNVAVVDADTGQSSVGPPACVSMAAVRAKIESLAELTPSAIDFVGASSPAGHLLQAVTSAAAMMRAAREAGADTIIVDTTGLVGGAIGRALKTAKIRLLDPEVLVALHAENDLGPLLVPYRARSRPQVVALPISAAARARSREARSSHRQQKFAAYFTGGHTLELSWERAPAENSAWMSGEPLPMSARRLAADCLGGEVLNAERRADEVFVIVSREPEPAALRRLADSLGTVVRAAEAGSLANLLVGLLGERGETLALGLLEAIDYRRRRVSVYTPLENAEAVKGLRLGAIRLARDGTQLAAGEQADGRSGLLSSRES